MLPEQNILTLEVMQVFTEDRSIVVMEAWYQDGKLCRYDGPAITHRSGVTGTVITECWYQNGQEGRDASPAIIEYDANGSGQRLLEAYKRNGRLHRRGGPALIKWSPDGDVLSEEWWINGEPQHFPGGQI